MGTLRCARRTLRAEAAAGVADILLVEDKDSLRAMLRRTLEARGYTVEEAADAYEARRRIQGERFLVVLTDLRLPAGSGFDVLQAALEADAETPVLVMTAFGTIEEAVRAMKEGAADFLTKPVDNDHLLLLLERAIDRRRLLVEYVLLKEEHQRRYGLPRILGEDPAFRETMLSVQRAAASDATVLLLGESGTGKELLARAVHQLSPRAKAPFVAINCAAIPEALLENELFGHEKGAFTGASTRKIGKAEMAHRGTLFLDEIADLPLPLQAKILRLVQEKQFERVGGVQTITVDVRVVAATNRDLKEAVARKEFREDLYFRLSVFPVEIPPLRRRRGDILPLAEAFLERLGRERGRRGLHLSPAARQALVEHAWPGNVRELQNCLERAAILCDGTEIAPGHLLLGGASAGGPSLADVLDLTGSLSDVTQRAASQAEAEAIRRTLLEVPHDRTAAAARLGVSVSTLGRRIKALGIEPD
jgi:DNA-binding NtrC family response regulator